MRSALFWDIAQRMVVIPYRRFGATSQSHLQGSRNPYSSNEKRGEINKLENKFHSVLLGLLLRHMAAITRHSNC